MLHPETIDLANSTILQTSPAEILHIPRQYSQHVSDDTLAHDSQRVFDCETLEVMAGVDPGLDVLDERNHLEEVLVDCALWWRGGAIPGHHALKWLILFVLPIVRLRIDSFLTRTLSPLQYSEEISEILLGTREWLRQNRRVPCIPERA